VSAYDARATGRGNTRPARLVDGVRPAGRGTVSATSGGPNAIAIAHSATIG